MEISGPALPSPLQFSCAHLASAEERHRDPHYSTCNAQPGQPCRWALRYDGGLNPPFHSERLEASLAAAAPDPACSPSHLRDLLLNTGLV